MIKILFISDIFGKPGRKTLIKELPKLKSSIKYDLIIANVENAAAGAGINKSIYEELVSLGIDYFTSGNHIWDRKEVLKDINSLDRLIRPLNYPEGVPGKGWIIADIKGKKAGIINLVGRVFMDNYECPFKEGIKVIEEIRKTTNVIIIDFHAEATSEKAAFAWHVDGKVSAVLGTHTHVMTADERILPKGTAFITDAGMTGPYNSSIGVEVSTVLQKFLTLMPVRFEPAEGDTIFNAIDLEVDEKTGRALSIKRIQEFVREDELIAG